MASRKKDVREESQSSSDDEEDPRLAYKKALKSNLKFAKKSEKQEMPPILGPPSNGTSNKDYALSLFKDRGLTISDQEVQKMVTQNSPKEGAQKKQKGSSYISGQGAASLKELQKELTVALNKKDLRLCVSILTTIVQHEQPQAQKIEYSIMRANFMLQVAQHNEAKEQAESLVKNFAAQLTAKQLLNIRIILASAKAAQGQTWNAYMEILRANSLTRAAAEGPQPTLQEGAFAQDLESVLKALDEAFMQILVKAEGERRVTDYLFVSGSSSTGALGLGKNENKLPKEVSACAVRELRNRKIISMACSEYHVLVLVAACSCQNAYEPNYSCTQAQCNGGYEVFGWGENGSSQATGDERDGAIIYGPHLLRQFSGKRIAGVGAYKSTSFAFDSNGQVYEWGACAEDNVEIKEVQKLKIAGLVQLCKGNGFYFALTAQKRAFFYGMLSKHIENGYGPTLLKCATPNDIGIAGVVSIHAGDNHLLCTDESGKVYVFGDNEYGQCGLKTSSRICKEWTELEAVRHLKFSRVGGSRNISLLFTSEGELFMCGQLSASRTVDFVKEAEFPDSCQIVNAAVHGAELFALSDTGKMYHWDVDQQPKFKEHEKLRNESFRTFVLGHGFQVLQKQLFKAELCQLSLAQRQDDQGEDEDEDKDEAVEDTQKLHSLQPIKLRLALRDELGAYSLTPFVPVRCHIVCSPKILKEDDILVNSRQFSVVNRARYSENRFYFDELLFQHLAKCGQTKSSGSSADIVDFEIVVAQQGTYFLYVLLNEELVAGSPLRLDIQESRDEEDKQRQLQEERNKRNQARELERQKALEKQKLRAEEEKRALEEEEQRRQQREETDRRAKENYDKWLWEQNQKKIKEDFEKRQRKELLTGGGFDLSKLEKKKTQEAQPAPLSMTEEDIEQEEHKKPQPLSSKSSKPMQQQQQQQQQQQHHSVNSATAGKNQRNAAAANPTTAITKNVPVQKQVVASTAGTTGTAKPANLPSQQKPTQQTKKPAPTTTNTAKPKK